jgi:hypothetical protein
MHCGCKNICMFPRWCYRTGRQWGVVVLSPEAFDAAEKALKESGQPTEANKRGAAMLRRLYGGRPPHA